MKQAHIIYSGMVQGVGFRFTVHRIASRLPVNGWVKNLANGSVEILVEGDEPVIEQLCEMIEERFKGNIDDKQISFAPAEGQYKEFDIAF